MLRSVNTENALRQASRVNASEKEDHKFFQDKSIQILILNKKYGLEVSLPMNFFSEFIYYILFYFTSLFKNIIIVFIRQIMFICFINSVFFYKKKNKIIIQIINK